MTGGPSPQDRRRLNRLLDPVIADAACVGAARARRIAEECGPGVTEQDVVAALQARDVRVAELPALPAAAPVGLPAGLLGQVQELRFRLSIEVVFGNELSFGFRVLDGVQLDNGRRLDPHAVTEAARQAVDLPDGPDRALREAVLADLSVAAAAPGALDAIVLWEVVGPLRELRRDGFTQMALAKQAANLGLTREEADLIAAAVAEEVESSDEGYGPAEDGEPTAAPLVENPAGAIGTAPPVTGDSRGPATPASPRPSIAPKPTAVVDLRVRPGRHGYLNLSWTPPIAGVLALRRASRAPRWAQGTVISSAEMTAHGTTEPTAGAVPLPGGRVRREVMAPDEPFYLTALTVAGRDAVVGVTVQLTAATPVRELAVRRFRCEARLSWVWPDDAVSAVVSWRPDGGAAAASEGPNVAESVRCSRRAYQDGGGLSVPVGHLAVTIEVRAAYGYDDAQVLAPPVEVRLEALGVPVSYRIRRRPWTLPPPLGRRRYEVVLTAAAACDLPDLVVVEGRTRLRPEAPEQGVPVATQPRRSVEAGEPVLLSVDPTSPGPSWLVCFVDPQPLGDGDAGIILEPPPVPEQRRR